MYKKIILTLFYLNIGFGASPINSMAKSFLIPGWGEMDFGYEKSSKFYRIINEVPTILLILIMSQGIQS